MQLSVLISLVSLHSGWRLTEKLTTGQVKCIPENTCQRVLNHDLGIHIPDHTPTPKSWKERPEKLQEPEARDDHGKMVSSGLMCTNSQQQWRSAQGQSSQHPTMEWEGVHEPPPLT